jgi:hypothetical protein
VISGDGRGRSLLILVGGLVVTLAAVAAVVLLWPDDDGGDEVVAEATTTPELGGTSTTGAGTGEPSQQTTTTGGSSSEPVQLFERGADAALADMASAAGDPAQAIQVSVYPTYAFLAYRDPDQPDHIDRRSWRDGEDQDDAAPNPITDRVDGDSTPRLFALDQVDLAILPRLIDDAAGRFAQDVEVTHVIIDRFLPFDERVLIRVYATPTDGRSGGGYVQYTLAGTYVKTIE